MEARRHGDNFDWLGGHSVNLEARCRLFCGAQHTPGPNNHLKTIDFTNPRGGAKSP